MQTDFIALKNLDEFMHVPIRETWPASWVFETWIKKFFVDSQVNTCTTTIQQLPMWVESFQGMIDDVLELRGNLPHRHAGVLAIRMQVTPNGDFSGQMWVLWSNSRIAAAAVTILHGQSYRESRPLHAERSRTAFLFAPSGQEFSRPRYGEACWGYT